MERIHAVCCLPAHRIVRLVVAVVVAPVDQARDLQQLKPAGGQSQAVGGVYRLLAEDVPRAARAE